MIHHLNEQTIEILKQYFLFDQIFDLKNYDLNNMYQLYLDLKELKKESYLQNYRFIFLHYEIEYYLHKQYPGLTLTNLQRVLSSLDISNFFCLILTQQDIRDKLKFLQEKETTDQTAIDSLKYQNFYWSNDYLQPMIDKDIEINIEKVSKSYLCLNRRSRFHRRVLFSLLRQNQLLDKGEVSYHNFDNRGDGSKSDRISQPPVDRLREKNLCLLQTSTCTRINDRWLLHNEHIKKAVDDIPIGYSFTNFNEPYAFHQQNELNPLDPTVAQKYFLHVVSEAVYNYPSSFLTEKSLKAILCKRPFVIVGPPGSLYNLKSLGFQTFDRWWNEDYDQIEDNEARLLSVIDIVKYISQKDILSLKDMCDQMKNVLEYNFDFYMKHFKQQQINSLHEFCRQNLQPRYD